MEKLLYPNNSALCIITGFSDCGKSVFLTNLFLNFVNEQDKIYIYSPSLHQNIYQKLFICFGNHIPLHINPNILSEKDVNVVIEEIVINKDFQNQILK